MAKPRVMTAPLAIIKSNGVPIGKMKSIRVTESVRRQKVVGLGKLIASEWAATDIDCSLNCGFFMINLKDEAIAGSYLRKVNTVQEFEDTVLLSNDGVQIDIMRKVKLSQNANGIITSGLEVFASIKGCFLNRESFDISEGQISGRDVDFNYSIPILYPL